MGLAWGLFLDFTRHSSQVAQIRITSAFSFHWAKTKLSTQQNTCENVGTKQRGYFIKLLLNVLKKNLMLDAVRFVEGIIPNTCQIAFRFHTDFSQKDIHPTNDIYWIRFFQIYRNAGHSAFLKRLFTPSVYPIQWQLCCAYP